MKLKISTCPWCGGKGFKTTIEGGDKREEMTTIKGIDCVKCEGMGTIAFMPISGINIKDL